MSGSVLVMSPDTTEMMAGGTTTKDGSFNIKGLKDGKARFTDRCHSVFTGVYAADTIQSGRLDYYDGTIYFEGDFVNDQPYDGLWYYVKGNKPFVRLTQGKENKADE